MKECLLLLLFITTVTQQQNNSKAISLMLCMEESTQHKYLGRAASSWTPPLIFYPSGYHIFRKQAMNLSLKNAMKMYKFFCFSPFSSQFPLSLSYFECRAGDPLSVIKQNFYS